MPTRARKRALYIAAESSFTTDPSADGSGYTPVWASDVSFADPGKEVLETNYFVGRNTNTPAIRGNDSAQITFTTPLIGLASAAGDGTAASSVADDWLDLLLMNAFGSPGVETTGDGVASSTASNITFDDTPSASFTNQDLVAVVDAAINSGRAQVRRLGGTASPYTLHRDWGANPTGTAVGYGGKIHRGPIDNVTGNYLSACLDLDGTIYMLNGGRVTGLQLSMSAGQKAELSWTMQFDRRTEDSASKTALPVLDTFSGSPIIGQLASVAWGSTEYHASQVSVDFGLSASPIASVAGVNGRSGIEVMRADPTITIQPAFATSWEDDFDAPTLRTIEIKYGSGALSGGAINLMAFFAESAEIVAPPSGQDDSNYLRQQVQFAVRDPGVFTGTTPGHYFQLARF